jgi:uncharacterized protein (TIGR02246 family)
MTDTAVQTAVQTLLDDMTGAWAANDAAAFAALYTPDATVFLADGRQQRGREAIREFMTTAFAGPFRGSASVLHVRDIRRLGPQAAIVTAANGVLLAGDEEVSAGRMRPSTWVLTEQAGRWLVAGYHNSHPADQE